MKNNIIQRKRTMNLSIIEGSLYSGMVGFAQYFITPFALFLGMPDFMIGILRSTSSLISAIGYYLSTWLLHFERTRKEMISKYIHFQAYMILLFLILPLLPNDKSIPFILLFSLYLFFGSVISPIWTGLMRDVVIKKERGAYFGMRNKITGLVDVSSSIIAGSILTFFTNNVYFGFITIFIVAFLFRIASSNLILKHFDPNPYIKKDSKSRNRVFQFQFTFVRDKYLVNLILLGGGMLFATNIAGPFFAVFMLKTLHFSYLDFTVANIISALATLISGPYWGRLIDKYGTRPVLFSTSVLIPFIPLLWVPADSLSYVILIQLYSGLVWAGFDLAVFNMLLKISPGKEVQLYSATYNTAVSVLTFLGMLSGSLLVFLLENKEIGFLNNIQIVFIISCVLRFLVTLLFIPKITKEMQVNPLKFLMKTISVYPIKGVLSEAEYGKIFAEQLIVSTSKLIREPIPFVRRFSKRSKAFIKLLSR